MRGEYNLNSQIPRFNLEHSDGDGLPTMDWPQPILSGVQSSAVQKFIKSSKWCRVGDMASPQRAATR